MIVHERGYGSTNIDGSHSLDIVLAGVKNFQVLAFAQAGRAY